MMWRFVLRSEGTYRNCNKHTNLLVTTTSKDFSVLPATFSATHVYVPELFRSATSIIRRPSSSTLTWPESDICTNRKKRTKISAPQTQHRTFPVRWATAELTVWPAGLVHHFLAGGKLLGSRHVSWYFEPSLTIWTGFSMAGSKEAVVKLWIAKTRIWASKLMSLPHHEIIVKIWKRWLAAIGRSLIGFVTAIVFPQTILFDSIIKWR